MTKITDTPEAVFLSGSDRLPIAGDVSGAWTHARPAGFDVYIIAGQSNATSIAANEEIDARLDWTHGRIWQWPTAHVDVEEAYRNKLIPAVDPLLFPPNFLSGPVKVSPGSTFARSILPFTPAGRDIILVPGAVPGVGLVNGSWQYPSGDLFVAAKNAAKACIDTLRALGVDARLRGVIWVQGENEAANLAVTPTQYQAAAIATLDALRDEVAPSDPAFVLVGQMNPDWIDAHAGDADKQTREIDAVHRDLPGLMDRCFFVHGPRDALGTGDIIHYGVQGQRDFGARMAEKARSVALLTNGAGMTAPTALAAVGATIFWTVPESDAPLFAIESRPAGSTGAYSRTLYSPPEYFRPGDTVSYTFTDISGAMEVRVAGYMAGAAGPFTDPITISWVSVPQPWYDPDFAHQSVSGGKVTSIPSLGTNTTPVAMTTGREPVPADVNGHAAMQTTVDDAYIICPTLPVGAYTFLVLVQHLDFAGTGFYVCPKESISNYLLWRGGGAKVLAGQNGNGAIVDSGSVLEAGKWYALAQVFDPTAPAGERLKLYINGVLIGQGSATNWSGTVTNLIINGSGGTITPDGNQNGNNAIYAALPIWTTALSAQQVAQVSTSRAAALGITLG